MKYCRCQSGGGRLLTQGENVWGSAVRRRDWRERRLEDWSSSVWGSGTYGERESNSTPITAVRGEDGGVPTSVPPSPVWPGPGREPWTGQTGYVARESTTYLYARRGRSWSDPSVQRPHLPGSVPSGYIHTWSVSYRFPELHYLYQVYPPTWSSQSL